MFPEVGGEGRSGARDRSSRLIKHFAVLTRQVVAALDQMSLVLDVCVKSAALALWSERRFENSFEPPSLPACALYQRVGDRQWDARNLLQ